jgi:holin-like protein
MRIPLQLAIIFAICLAGEFLNRIVGIPLPGNIIGMVLLLILLCLKVIKLEQIATVSTVFLRYLPLFFLPPSIAIMAAGDDILSRWPLLLAMCIAFTVITMAVTGISTQFLIRLQEKREGQKANAGIDGAGGPNPSEKGGEK